MNTHQQQSSSRQNVEHKNYNYNSFNFSKSSALEQTRNMTCISQCLKNKYNLQIIKYKLIKTHECVYSL